MAGVGCHQTPVPTLLTDDHWPVAYAAGTVLPPPSDAEPGALPVTPGEDCVLIPRDHLNVLLWVLRRYRRWQTLIEELESGTEYRCRPAHPSPPVTNL